MGVASAENSDTAADMTTAKPRERQFQVVPVPGKFTRGRWQCWDYRDDKPDVSEKILDFTDKSEKNVAPSTVNAEAQSNTNATSNITSQLSADCASAAHPIIEQPQTILKAQQQPAGNAANATQNQADISLSTSTSTQQALAHKESRPGFKNRRLEMPCKQVNKHTTQVPSTVTIVNEEEAELDGELCESSRRSSLLSQSSETTETKSTKSCSTTISIPVGVVTLPDNVDSSPYYSISPSLPAVPANSFVNPSLISAIHHSASHQRKCAFQVSYFVYEFVAVQMTV
ncbi:unnamed protein product [Anisakis simplex]|uniref:Uncharacterized protein n=1 Tax=Anisakis simplex TaxID=6269 RepID=A0A0M3JSP1_ANISI|nr:unnamed protein product [Anisakis simplex]